VLDLTSLNKSLLCKWLWNLENSEDNWQQLLTRKYLKIMFYPKQWQAQAVAKLDVCEWHLSKVC
jgi:hypothetical protein